MSDKLLFACSSGTTVHRFFMLDRLSSAKIWGVRLVSSGSKNLKLPHVAVSRSEKLVSVRAASGASGAA